MSSLPLIISRKEARAAGLKRYFTGKPCKHGHIAERYLWGVCIECYRLHDAKPERSAKRRTRDKKWKKANVRAVSEKNRKQYIKNRKTRLTYASLYRKRNADKINQYNRDWREKNSKYISENRGKYYKDNKNAFLLRNRLRAAAVRGAGGKLTKPDLYAIFKWQHGKCAYCKISIKKKYEIDHIVPVKLGGSSDTRNIQLTCMSCNRRKRATDPILYARQIGLLI